MATESVNPYRGLSLEDVDRAHELIHQASAIADLIGCARTDHLMDTAIPGGCWAIRNMLTELQDIVCGKETQQ